MGRKGRTKRTVAEEGHAEGELALETVDLAALDLEALHVLVEERSAAEGIAGGGEVAEERPRLEVQAQSRRQTHRYKDGAKDDRTSNKSAAGGQARGKW